MQLWGFILSLSDLTLDNRFDSARYLSRHFGTNVMNTPSELSYEL